MDFPALRRIFARVSRPPRDTFCVSSPWIRNDARSVSPAHVGTSCLAARKRRAGSAGAPADRAAIGFQRVRRISPITARGRGPHPAKRRSCPRRGRPPTPSGKLHECSRRFGPKIQRPPSLSSYLLRKSTALVTTSPQFVNFVKFRKITRAAYRGACFFCKIPEKRLLRLGPPWG